MAGIGLSTFFSERLGIHQPSFWFGYRPAEFPGVIDPLAHDLLRLLHALVVCFTVGHAAGKFRHIRDKSPDGLGSDWYSVEGFVPLLSPRRWRVI